MDLPRVPLTGRALSHERYLRPTRNCDSHAPEVLALADEFRGRTGNDWEYAQAIFDFASNQIGHCFDFPARRGVVEVIERGFGLCHEKTNVLVALARAGGLPAGYCSVGVRAESAGVASLMQDGIGPRDFLNQVAQRFLAEQNDPRVRKIVAFLLARMAIGRRVARMRGGSNGNPSVQRSLPHPIAELKIGAGWVPADPTLSDEECAAYNFPLQRLGYQPLLLGKLMGTVIIDRSEEIPFFRARRVAWLVGLVAARGVFDAINRGAEAARTRGRQILADVGREEYVRKRKHFYRRIPSVAELGVSLPPYPSR